MDILPRIHSAPALTSPLILRTLHARRSEVTARWRVGRRGQPLHRHCHPLHGKGQTDMRLFADALSSVPIETLTDVREEVQQTNSTLH